MYANDVTDLDITGIDSLGLYLAVSEFSWQKLEKFLLPLG